MKELKSTAEFSTEEKIKEISKSFPSILMEMREHKNDLNFFTTTHNISILGEAEFASRFSELNEVQKFYDELVALEHEATGTAWIDKRFKEILNATEHSYEAIGQFEKDAQNYLSQLDMTKINQFNNIVDDLKLAVRKQVEATNKTELAKYEKEFDQKRKTLLDSDGKSIPLDEKTKAEVKTLDEFQQMISKDAKTNYKWLWVIVALIIFVGLLAIVGTILFLVG